MVDVYLVSLCSRRSERTLGDQATLFLSTCESESTFARKYRVRSMWTSSAHYLRLNSSMETPVTRTTTQRIVARVLSRLRDKSTLPETTRTTVISLEILDNDEEYIRY